MARLDLRSRILVAIGAGGLTVAACGGTEDGTGGMLGADGAADTTLANDGGGDATTGDGSRLGEAASDAFLSDAVDGPVDGTIGDAPVSTESGAEAGAEDGASTADSGDAADVVGNADSAADGLGGDGAGDAFTGDAAIADTGGDACAAYGQPCTQDSDCCNSVPCDLGGGPCNGQSGCTCHMSIRRPFLVGSSLRLAEAVESDDWQLEERDPLPSASLNPATAAALARDWLKDALDEHASIAAFARFTMHLVSVGAPPQLVVASQRAALDEVRHARACFALARRYGGRDVGPGPLPIHDAMDAVTLSEIAALTTEEGCVGETLGVLLAEEQLAKTTDPCVRSVLARAHIVTDEARHAELAWSFVRWAIARGGEPVRRAVAAAIRRSVAGTLAMPVRTYEGVDIDAWRAHGRLTCADARAVVERGVREIIEPCAAMLLGEPLATPAARAPAMLSCV